MKKRTYIIIVFDKKIHKYLSLFSFFRQPYEFWVTASTSRGEGEASIVVSQKTDSKGNAGI